METRELLSAALRQKLRVECQVVSLSGGRVVLVCIVGVSDPLFFLKDEDHETKDSRPSEALAPEKMVEAKHAAMGTRTRITIPNAPLNTKRRNP